MTGISKSESESIQHSSAATVTGLGLNTALTEAEWPSKSLTSGGCLGLPLPLPAAVGGSEWPSQAAALASHSVSHGPGHCWCSQGGVSSSSTCTPAWDSVSIRRDGVIESHGAPCSVHDQRALHADAPGQRPISLGCLHLDLLIPDPACSCQVQTRRCPTDCDVALPAGILSIPTRNIRPLLAALGEEVSAWSSSAWAGSAEALKEYLPQDKVDAADKYWALYAAERHAAAVSRAFSSRAVSLSHRVAQKAEEPSNSDERERVASSLLLNTRFIGLFFPAHRRCA